MLSFAVTHQDEGREEEGGGGVARGGWENALNVFLCERGVGRCEKGGDGAAGLCAVSNWIWQYIIRFSSIHQFPVLDLFVWPCHWGSLACYDA